MAQETHFEGKSDVLRKLTAINNSVLKQQNCELKFVYCNSRLFIKYVNSFLFKVQQATNSNESNMLQRGCT